jgi:hypothetical protein
VATDAKLIQAQDLLGPTLQILTPPSEDGDQPCLLRGTIPPGASVGTPPAPETVERFAAASFRRGHWLGTPEENAEVGVPG